jgi:hypothetical protein
VDKAEIELEKEAQTLLEDRLRKTVHGYYITRRPAAFHTAPNPVIVVL